MKPFFFIYLITIYILDKLVNKEPTEGLLQLIQIPYEKTADIVLFGVIIFFMQIKVFMVMEHEFASKLIKIDTCRGRDVNTNLLVNSSILLLLLFHYRL
jgi:hypothetical protein